PGQRARRSTRATSRMVTERGSNRIQPRVAKSASALLTVSRDAPTSWASAAWVRSWCTLTPSTDSSPNREARSSRALATRPGTSEKTRSATTSLARRSRPASWANNPCATSGCRVSDFISSSCSRQRISAGVTALAVDERGPGSNSDSSPNIWPGPSTAIRFSRPALPRRPSFTLPLTTTYNRSSVSPSWNNTPPRSSRTFDIAAANSAAAWVASPWNRGALRSTSGSTRPLPLHAHDSDGPTHDTWRSPSQLSGQATVRPTDLNTTETKQRPCNQMETFRGRWGPPRRVDGMSATMRAARSTTPDAAADRPDTALVRRARKINRILAETYPDARTELDFTNPYQLLVATVLSAQSTDKRVNAVTATLFPRYPTPQHLVAADRAELEELIRPTGFFRAKTDTLLKLGQQLVTEHDGEVPRTLAELVKL